MKVIKRGIYILTFIIALFIINVNVKAYDIFVTSHSGTYTEKEIFEEFSKVENFNINEYKNIYCTVSGTYGYCYALTDDTVSSLTYINYALSINETDNCGYYYILLERNDISKQKSLYRSCSYNNGQLTSISSKSSSNFNFNFFSDSDNSNYNKLDFSSYLIPEEEKPDLEITI